MAHFAQLDENNVVVWVTCLDNSIVTDENGIEQESLGIQYIHNTIPDAENYTWKQTSINHNFRGRFAAVGSIYNENDDIFSDPKPIGFDSWILDSDNTTWKPPIPRPEIIVNETEAFVPIWNEKTVSWDIVTQTKMFDSWIFLEELEKWTPPVPVPTDSPYYEWDEENQKWYFDEPKSE